MTKEEFAMVTSVIQKLEKADTLYVTYDGVTAIINGNDIDFVSAEPSDVLVFSNGENIIAVEDYHTDYGKHVSMPRKFVDRLAEIAMRYFHPLGVDVSSDILWVTYK